MIAIFRMRIQTMKTVKMVSQKLISANIFSQNNTILII